MTGPVGLSQPSVSHHMKFLVEAGLATREQRGKGAYCRVAAVLGSLAAALQPAGVSRPRGRDTGGVPASEPNSHTRLREVFALHAAEPSSRRQIVVSVVLRGGPHIRACVRRGRGE